MVYLDNAATTRVCPEAAEAAVHMMTECFGNPSTTYKLGREAKAAVDKARGQIAKALGCQPDEVYFTSCGSEGDNCFDCLRFILVDLAAEGGYNIVHKNISKSR